MGLAPLPFKCHMVSDAAEADVAKAAAPSAGKPEVFFPVGLPGHGYFDWLDQFLAKNPGCAELSDRAIINWAVQSGFWKPRQMGGSADKPEPRFGVPVLDDLASLRKTLFGIAATKKRNFIVPELKGNLHSEDRKKRMPQFHGYKKTAIVFAGEPTAEYKEKVQEAILAEKKERAVILAKRKYQ